MSTISSATSSVPAGTGERRPVSAKNTAIAAVIGAVGGGVINSLIAWVGRSALDVPEEFKQLHASTYLPLTILGAVLGAVGWHLIATRKANATTVLARLVPIVLVLSIIPDFLLLASDSQPGTTTAGVVALIAMHVGVAVAAVPAYRRFIPPQS